MKITSFCLATGLAIYSVAFTAIVQKVMADKYVSSLRQRVPGKMREIQDSSIGVTFVNELADHDAPHAPFYGLCRDAKKNGGMSKSNALTIRKILGPRLKKIVVLRVTQFETLALFALAQQAISEALQKSPKTISEYEPWANAVTPDFVARLEYDDGKIGQLEMTYGYICFQDHAGTHWWARVATPDDLNLDTAKETGGRIIPGNRI